jgi:DNA-binding XRE family transcriptional regulator
LRELSLSEKTNDARLVRSLRSREQKPKIFLTFLLFFGGGCGGSRQKMERKFLVLLRRFHIALYSNIVIECKISYAVDMKKGISKRLGENIKRIRTKKGMTQGDIFRALNLDRGYVSSLESGKRNPTLAMIEKIAGALGVSSDELLK